MAIPKFLQAYVASYDVSDLSIKRDEDLLITQVLNKGDDDAIKWLFKTYSEEKIKNFVQKPKRGMWHRRSLNYWSKILDVRIPKFNFELAVVELNYLRPKLYKKFYSKLNASP